MIPFLPDKLWRLNEKKLLKIIESGAFVPNPKLVYFYAPSFMYYRARHYYPSRNSFPTVSITGKQCSLNCRHCGGKILETMNPAETPEKLLEFAMELKKKSAAGFLLSSGCRPDGSVPIDKFIPVIKKIKRELNLAIFVHTGIIDRSTATKLRDAGTDAALIDILGSNETIQSIFNSNITVDDYANSLNSLYKSGLNLVPHVIVGLDGGRLKGEFQALKMISEVNPAAIVIIAFIPLSGTDMFKIDPPRPIDVTRVAAVTRVMFPKTPLVLGCMRPKGRHRQQTEILAVQAGVNGIAFPNEETIKYCKSQEYELRFFSNCCAAIYSETIS